MATGIGFIHDNTIGSIPGVDFTLVGGTYSVPPTPNSGQLQFYPKTDGSFYTKNSAGTEVLFGAALGYAPLWRAPVVAAGTANVTVSAPGANLDGFALTANDRILLTGQSAPAENGLWLWNSAVTALTRPTDYAAASTSPAYGLTVMVLNGTVGKYSMWYLTTTGVITVDTTSTAWSTVGGLQVRGTTEQLRLGYNAANYAAFTVSSGGDLTVAPSGGDTTVTGTLTVSGYLALAGLTLSTGTVFNAAATLASLVGDGTNYILSRQGVTIPFITSSYTGSLTGNDLSTTIDLTSGVSVTGATAGNNRGAITRMTVTGSGGATYLVAHYMQFRNQSSGTIATAGVLFIPNATNTGGGTITSSFGQIIDNQTRGGTGNSNLILGTTTVPAGNWSIYSASTYDSTFAGNSRFGSTTAPTAKAHLAAGTTAASTAPLKFTTGTSMTAAEAGAAEFTTDDLFFTITTGTARKRLLMADAVGGLTSGRVPFGTTNGRLLDSADLTFNDTTNVVTVTAGTGSGAAKLGGGFFDHSATSTVGGAEADIYTDTLPASTFAVNGDKVSAYYAGNFVTVGTESVQLKVYLAGTAVWDSTGVAVTTGTTSWAIRVEVIRASSTSLTYIVTLSTTGASAFNYATSGVLTGLTLANTAILKATGTSTGVGSGSGDIVGNSGAVFYYPSIT